MHFVTGGAFNGKRAWVKKTYSLQDNFIWISAYEQHDFPVLPSDFSTSFVILEGVEQWVRSLMKDCDVQQCRETWRMRINQFEEYEKTNPDLTFVLIGADITKGIVPMEKQDRLWRDVTGWVYQDIAAKAKRVDVIWYGINQTIK